MISIHALCEEGDHPATRNHKPEPYFYPRPLRGGRPTAGDTVQGCKLFLSTPSARRATKRYRYDRWCRRNFYPRPLRGGRPLLHPVSKIHAKISIHALCEEGDGRACCFQPVSSYFYPRPLRGGRPPQRRQQTGHGKFLSTPSARRATLKTC